MSRAVLRRIPLRAAPVADWAGWAKRISLALFIAAIALLSARELKPESILPGAGWPEGLCLVLAAATTVCAIGRSLPAQNVLLSCAIIAVLGAGIHLVAVLTGIPFGPILFGETAGPNLGLPLPWCIPFLWLVLVLNARGVARLAVRPWRKTRAYGFWVIGLTCLLTVGLTLGMEPYAGRIHHFWLWGPTRGGFTWYSAPWVNFIAWGLATLLILAFATPSLINKKPNRSSPPDYYPLWMWLLLNALFGLSAGWHQMWPAVGLIAGLGLTTVVFALRGARW